MASRDLRAAVGRGFSTAFQESTKAIREFADVMAHVGPEVNDATGGIARWLREGWPTVAGPFMGMAWRQMAEKARGASAGLAAVPGLGQTMSPADFFTHISQMPLGVRHEICAEILEIPAFPTIPCHPDRGTLWVTATITPCASISTARSSWSSTARPSPVTPGSSPTANSTTPLD
jgi:hypothetical protein